MTCTNTKRMVDALFLPIAEVCTLWWMLITLQLLFRKVSGTITHKTFVRKFSITWFAYCVPIHIHGRKKQRAREDEKEGR